MCHGINKELSDWQSLFRWCQFLAMGEPELDLGSAPAHWGMNFTKSIHTQPTTSTSPANVSLPPDYTVLITGAGKGIGEHIAKSFVQAGASRVIITSRTRPDLERVKKELERLAEEKNRSIRCSYIVQDAAKVQSYIALHDLVRDEFGGRLDCLVCNAGGGPVKTLWTPRINETNTTEWDDSIALNFTSAYYAASQLIPLILDPKSVGKTIINISSAAAHFAGGNITPAAYSIGKLALNRFTESLAEDYKSQGLVAVALHPGSVPTPGALSIMPSSLHNSKISSITFQSLASHR